MDDESLVDAADGEGPMDEEDDAGADESVEPEVLRTKNPALEAFLKRWDRDLPDDRRCYGIKLCFAGCESKKVRDGLFRIGVRHILVSYFYLRRWLKSAPVQEIAEDLGRFEFVFLDSGGFTFLSALKEGKDLGLDANAYAAEYYAALPKFSQFFAGCAEVDLYDTFDPRWMDSQRTKLQLEGVPIVPVIQGFQASSLENWGWFEKYPYMAIGSGMLGDSKHVMDVLGLLEAGKKYGNVFHGFGVTSANTILRSQFYSVDSTSWTGGSRFGASMFFQNGRIRHYDKKHKDVRKRYKRRLEENGVIWTDIEADKGFEVDMMNALAWKQWADYIRYSANRCYWLTPEEKSKALDLKSKAFNVEGLIDRSRSIERAQFRRLTQVDDPFEDDRGHETLYCDTCHMTGRCPRFRAGQVCGYDINVRLETKEDLQRALQRVLEVEYGRVMTAQLFEKLEGGVIDGNVSNEMRNFIGMIQQVRGIYDPRETLTIQAKGGSGAVAQMLAAVFNKGGSTGGSLPVERAAKKVEGQVAMLEDPRKVIDVGATYTEEGDEVGILIDESETE